MKLQDQVIALEQAKRLKELRICQDSYFLLGEETGRIVETWLIEGQEDNFYSAFTVAEMGVMLPAGYDTMYCTNDGWRGYDLDGKDMCDSKPFKTARAAMLIHLLEIKVITPEEVNARLCA